MKRFMKIMLVMVGFALVASFSLVNAQTETPAPTATPEPTLAPLTEDNLPVISAANAGQLKLLGGFDDNRFYGFSPDGKTLLYMDPNRTVQEWDIYAGKSTLSFTLAGTYGLLSADGKTLTSINANSGVAIETWDMTSRKMISSATLANFPSGAYPSEYGLSGAYFITADDKGHNFVGWDTSTGKQLFSVPFLGTSAGTVAFSPDGKSALGYESSGGMQLIDLASGKVLWSAQSDNLNGGNVLFSPDGQALALVDTNVAAIDFLDTATGKKTGSVAGDPSGTTYVLNNAFSPDSKTFILETGDGSSNSVTTYDLTGKAQTATPADNLQVMTITTSPDGTLAVVVEPQRDVQIVEVASGKVLDKIPLGADQIPNKVSFSPDGKLLALGFFNVIELWGVGS